MGMDDQFSHSKSESMSGDIRLLAQAILMAKKDFKCTGLGGTNAHQKYKYAKLGDIYNAIEDALSNNNIVIWHFSSIIFDKEALTTRLTHAPSGQWIQDVRICESEKPGNQAKGSANTYMKKYALLALCAITAEDDDGEEEEKHISKKSYDPSISTSQLKTLQDAIKESEKSKEIYNNLRATAKIQSLADMPASSFEYLESKVSGVKSLGKILEEMFG